MSSSRASILVELERRRHAAIRRAFTRIDPVALGAGTGAVAAVGLFLATAVLVVRGSGQDDVGAHLGLLGHYFPGFAVTWSGALIGLLWAAVFGFVGGFAVAGVRNAALRFVLWKAGADQRRFRRRHLLDEI